MTDTSCVSIPKSPNPNPRSFGKTCQDSEKMTLLKALLNTNVLNDVTAAPFLVSFLQLAAEKNTETGAAVTSFKDVRT